VFGFSDWVGGRFSTWSAIGLPLAIAIGAASFRAFLDGARQMDEHFRTAPLERNLPVLLAMIGIWRRNAMGWPTAALVPYDQRLARLPAYVQQVELESNGKRVGRDNLPVGMATAPVVWGEPGTNSQHSFFQMIHQGTDTIPVDFLLARADRRPPRPTGRQRPGPVCRAGLRQDARRGPGRDGGSGDAARPDRPAGPAPHLSRRPALDDDPLPPPRPGDAGPPDGAFRA
jgi:glucose-6-phosphate isomerase